MTIPPRSAWAGATIIAVVIVAAVAWRLLTPAEERVVRGRLAALVDDFNDPSEGPASLAKAIVLASYFTEDVRVDLASGGPPIVGREALIGAAASVRSHAPDTRARIERMAVSIDDSGTSANVRLTASLIGRDASTNEETRDERDFALVLTKADGTWRIARVTATDVPS